MREPAQKDRTNLIALAILACLGVGGASYVHPEWFTRLSGQQAKPVARVTRPDEEFAAVYTKYGVPALDKTVSSSYDIRPHLASLTKEPCNKHAIYELSVNLEHKIGYRATADLLQGYARVCPESSGEQYRAAELLYGAGDFKGSIDAATQVLALQPDATNVLYLRGRALQGDRRFNEALQDYASTIRTISDGKQIVAETFMRMSQAYEALNRHCEAITPIQVYIAYEPERRSTSQLENKIAELSKKGSCSSAKGHARIPRRTAGVMTSTAEINGVRGSFVIDTGASFVTLSKSFAARAQVTPMGASAVELETATGAVVSGALATAKTIRLDAISAPTVPVVIVDKAPGSGVDGLLGMSFLSRFNVLMTDKELTIRDKNSK